MSKIDIYAFFLVILNFLITEARCNFPQTLKPSFYCTIHLPQFIFSFCFPHECGQSLLLHFGLGLADPPKPKLQTEEVSGPGEGGKKWG